MRKQALIAASIVASVLFSFSPRIVTGSTPTPLPSASTKVPNTTTKAPIRITQGKPLVVGHNGGAGIAPEDTIVGINATSAAGATMVDIDVRWSANNNTQSNPGYPVLMHDDTVDRTTNGTGAVSSLGLHAMLGFKAQDYAPWKTDPAYANVYVPYAWEFFNASATTGITLEMDVKVTPTEWAAKKLMEYADMFPGSRDRMIFMNDLPGIIAMRQWFPTLTYTLIEYPPTGVMRTGEYLKSLGITTYSVPFQNITPAFVNYYHSYGIKVGTWTTDLPSYDNVTNWQAMKDDGVDLLTTQHVADYLAWQPN
jgi:glycerophosphoryl diester phosphodiesterase